MNLYPWILYPLRKFWQLNLTPSLAFIADDVKSMTCTLFRAFLVLKANSLETFCNIFIQEYNEASLANTFNMFILMSSLLFPL